jgi:hypothetical protein
MTSDESPAGFADMCRKDTEAVTLKWSESSVSSVDHRMHQGP